MPAELLRSVDFLPSKEKRLWVLERASLDNDGIFPDTHGAVTTEYNRRHLTNHLSVDIVKWDSVYEWGVKDGMTEKRARKEEFDLWYRPKTLSKAEPVLGVVEFAEKIQFSDYIINSSRNSNLLVATRKWFKKKLPFIDRSRIYLGLPDLDPGISKVWRILQHGSRIHFEDRPPQAKQVLDYTDAYVVLLSDSSVLDGYAPGRLLRIAGENGKRPNFVRINEFFFGK